MSDPKIILREGYPFAFTVTFSGFVDGGGAGIPARYTAAQFAVRKSPDTALDALVEVDETNGISIDHDEGVVSVSISGTDTENLSVDDARESVYGELRLYDPTNTGDRIGRRMPIFIEPTVIGDV